MDSPDNFYLEELDDEDEELAAAIDETVEELNEFILNGSTTEETIEGLKKTDPEAAVHLTIIAECEYDRDNLVLKLNKSIDDENMTQVNLMLDVIHAFDEQVEASHFLINLMTPEQLQNTAASIKLAYEDADYEEDDED